MTQTAQFGRRGLAAPKKTSPAAAGDFDVVLTPEQRAWLLDDGNLSAETRRSPSAASDPHALPWSRWAGFAACTASTCLVAAFTLTGKPHEIIAALPPMFEPAAKDLVAQTAGGWFGAVSIAWSIFIIASNLGLNLWLSHKFCGLTQWRGLPAFTLTGAAVSAAIAFLTAAVGLGDSEIGYAMEALSGGGAAFLYRLLAGGSCRAR
jgi:hypothetical protein